MSKKSKHISEDLKQSTKQSYGHALNKYCKYHNLTFDELLTEALEEQTNNTPVHQLSLYDRLLSFRGYISKEMSGNSVRLYMTIIKHLYRNNRVSVPDLPLLNTKNLIKNEEIEYSDLLTKPEIKKAISHLTLRMNVRLRCQVTAGLSNAECGVLTKRQFIDDLYPYHQCDNDRDALFYLADKNHCHIWVTKLKRVKTGKPYYAVFPPETVQMIALAKLEEKEEKDKLLTNNPQSYTNRLNYINDEFGFGTAGGLRRLRSHMLRKFHSTSISTAVLDYGEESSLRNFEIDELQGRGKTSVQATYMKTNPIRQKLLYAKVMNKVCLDNEYEYEYRDGDVHVWVKNNKKLQRDYDLLKKSYDKNSQISDELKNYIDVVGYDNFKKGLSDLLAQM